MLANTVACFIGTWDPAWFQFRDLIKPDEEMYQHAGNQAIREEYFSDGINFCGRAGSQLAANVSRLATGSKIVSLAFLVRVS